MTSVVFYTSIGKKVTANPRNEANPTTSVTVVKKIDENLPHDGGAVRLPEPTHNRPSDSRFS
jgi:hypothetical protein